MGGEGREGKGRERSALGRVGNCLGPARGKNCGASGRVTGAHLRVQLHPVLERFDAELPLAAHRVVSSNTILRHLLRAPRGDLASAPRCEFLLLFFREGTRRMEKTEAIRRLIRRAVRAARFLARVGLGLRHAHQQTKLSQSAVFVFATRLHGRQSTRATRPPARRRASTTRTPARTSIRRETRSKATDTPPSPRHTRATQRRG